MKLLTQPLALIKVIGILFMALALTSCLQFDFLGGDSAKNEDETTESEDMSSNTSSDSSALIFAAAKQLPYVPWFLAHQENLFSDYGGVHGVNIEFQPGDYKDIIQMFIDGGAQAIALTNIDAVINFIPENIEADIILVSSYSNGNDLVIVPNEDNVDLKGKSIALMQYSVSHYLLDRYLLKQQINFDDVEKIDTPEIDIVNAFGKSNIYGVATWNPMAQTINKEMGGKILFTSRSIPKEISHLLVVRRETLEAQPGFGNALLAIWINIMERMQGNQRGNTLDMMAGILNVERDKFEEELDSIIFTDTQIKALSTIRDRSMRKTMRHIRYFMKRNQLTNDDIMISNMVSYPGRSPALLHYNAKSLQSFAAGAGPED